MAQLNFIDLDLIDSVCNKHQLKGGEALQALHLYGHLEGLHYDHNTDEFNQSEFARRTGLSRTTVRKYVNLLESMNFAEFTRTRDCTKFVLKGIRNQEAA